MSLVISTSGVQAGWFRSRTFDLNFILGIACLALASGAIVVREPDLFGPILFADLWLLGYHHVVSTYTRLCFDRENFEKYRFLILRLPIIVMACVIAMGLGIGVWTLPTVYLYWQWFHYTRQSWGVSQIYRRRSGGLARDPELFSKLVFYALPLAGILYRSYQDPGKFLGFELRVIPIPEWAVHLVGLAAIGLVGAWLVMRLVDWWNGRMAVAHTIYMASHFVIFVVSYIVIEDITYGWLVVNIWHNAQYIAFVWVYNNNRFKNGVEEKAKFLSFISQKRNVWLYLLICFSLSTALYLALENSLVLLLPAIVIYQTLNFHHYIVDSLIWKVRKPKMQQTLGLQG